MSKEDEVIQKVIDGLTTGQSLNHLGDMIDSIDDVMIELIDEKWAIEDHLIDPLIPKMNNILSSLNKTGTLYKGNDYGTKNLEEWAWYKNTGINASNLHYIDGNTFYVNGDIRSTLKSGTYILVNNSIARRVETVNLSASNTYVYLSTDPEDNLWNNPYYDPNKATYPTCVSPNTPKSQCDCYVLTEEPYTTTTSTTTTLKGGSYVPGVFRITIDMNKVGEDLDNFPVFINLSNSSGIYNFDLSEIFNEVGLDWRKIYIQDSYPFNSGNNLWIEKDFWESDKANLYVKVPVVRSNGYFQNLYLYYGSDLSDNDHIGWRSINGNSIDQKACYTTWNSGPGVYDNYYSVYHFSEDESSITSSPSWGESSVDTFDMKIANGIENLKRVNTDTGYAHYVGSPSYFYQFYQGQYIQLRKWTVEVYWKPINSSINLSIFSTGNSTGGYNKISYEPGAGLNYYSYLIYNGVRPEDNLYGTGFSPTSYNYNAITWENDNDEVKRLYYNGSIDTYINYPELSIKPFQLYNKSAKIGSDIIINELRISPVRRSPNWISATYQDLNDNFVYYSGVLA